MTAAMLMLFYLATLMLACTVVVVVLSPAPKVKPAPLLDHPWSEPPPKRLELPEPPFDPSAFWNYPDWDGPLDEPFWMRPIKVPMAITDPLRAALCEGQPIPMAWGKTHVPGVPVSFMILNGETFAETLVDGERRMTRISPSPDRLAVEDHVRRLRELASGDNRFSALILEPERMTPEEARRRTLMMMRARRLG